MRKHLMRFVAAMICLWTAGVTIARAEGDATPKPAPAEKSGGSLSERVSQLEKKLAAFEESSGQKFRQIQENELRLHFNLYGDVEYSVMGLSNAFPQANEFRLGQTDLHIMAQYGEHLSGMSEDVVEFDGQDPVIDLERIVVFYTVSDQLRLGAGRDHTAFGYWNRTFHHGAQLQTTIDRPFFLRFEDGGGSTPAHIVGLFANGTFDMGGSLLKYELNIGNGQSIGLVGDGAGNVAEAAFNLNPSGDNNTDKSFAGRLVFKPDAGGGLALGAAAVWNKYDVIPTADLVATSNPLVFTGLGQVLLEAEVIYTDENFEFLSEFYNFDNAVAGMPTQGSASNTAFYAQLGVQAAPDLKPYVRVENLTVDTTDPYFLAMGQSTKTVWLGGLRLDIVPVASSLKLEARFINANGVNATEVASAWGFGF